MQTKDLKIELRIDGVAVKIGYELLESLSRNIPDIKENAKVFEKLALSHHYEVRENIAEKKIINKKTIKLLLKDKRHGLITRLLRNTKVASKFSFKTIKKIIALDNPIHSETIAENLGDFIKCDSCKLAKILLKHKDPAVRGALCRRWHNTTPKSIIKKLTFDKDVNVANDAKEYLELGQK